MKRLFFAIVLSFTIDLYIEFPIIRKIETILKDAVDVLCMHETITEFSKQFN